MAVDWSTEWFTSIVWIIGVTIAVGGRVRPDRLAPGALDRVGTAVRPAGLPLLLTARPAGVAAAGHVLLLLLLLTIASVRLTVLFSYVNNDLFTALQQLDPSGFLRAS